MIMLFCNKVLPFKNLIWYISNQLNESIKMSPAKGRRYACSVLLLYQ